MTAPVPPAGSPAHPPERGEGEPQPKALRLEVAAGSDQGRARSYNEDTIRITPPELAPSAPRGYLFMVADGMGGHNAGEVASAGAVQRIYQAYYDDADPDVLRSLDKVVRRANGELYAQAQANPAQHGMGTTFTCLVILGDRGYLAHVGDSRLYRIRGGKPEQLTQDHSWVAEQVRAGVLTPEQAEVHPQRNVITRALATAPDVQVDRAVVDLQPGDVLVLCSDGLSTKVSDAQIATLATKYATAHEAVQRLINLANENGGDDNISVAVIRVLRPDENLAATAATVVPLAQPIVARPKASRRTLLWVVPLAVLLAAAVIGGGVMVSRKVFSNPPSSPVVTIPPGTVEVVAPTSTPLPGAIPAQDTPAPPVAGETTPEATIALQQPMGTDAATPEATVTLLPSPLPSPTLPAEQVYSAPSETSTPVRGPRRTVVPQIEAPTLLEPDGSTASGTAVKFSWASDHSIQGSEGYALFVWPVNDPQYKDCRGLSCPTVFDVCNERWAAKSRMVSPSNALAGFKGSGEYYWTVVIVDTGKPELGGSGPCRVISDQPAPHRFTYEPPGGGGGGGGGAEPTLAPP